MDGHYNLYYLFLDDKQKNPMPEQKMMDIRKKLEKFFKNVKPPAITKPPITTKGDVPDKNKGD